MKKIIAFLFFVLFIFPHALWARSKMAVGGFGGGNFQIANTFPNLDIGAGGGISFDYRFNQHWGLQTSLSVFDHDGEGASAGDNGMLAADNAKLAVDNGEKAEENRKLADERLKTFARSIFAGDAVVAAPANCEPVLSVAIDHRASVEGLAAMLRMKAAFALSLSSAAFAAPSARNFARSLDESRTLFDI